MHVQFWQSKRIVQYLSIIVLLSSSSLFAQLADLIQLGLGVADAVNQTMLDITALTDEEENEVGQELKRIILKEKKPASHNKWNVEKVFNKVVKNVSRKALNYDCTIVSDEDVNAFAIAGGPIFINTGLLDFTKSEDELAFIICHEIAHNERKHCVKSIQYSVIANQVDPLFGSIVGIAYSIYNKPFNMSHEYEADEYGVYLMQKAGYSKNGAISFFERMIELEKKYQKEGVIGVNDFIPSHPNAQQRIDAIKKM
ncbi:MAG: M48 family metallopeptidase [Candidatus Cloacimonadales bacterium]|nr:M48 family metallopeptidase [Candidatus Cloacimonadales bacterium]